MTQEDFEFVADQVGLWGAEREALRLQQVESLDVPLIAEQLEILPAAIREILEQAGRRVAAHEWPAETPLRYAQELLQVMRGPKKGTDKATPADGKANAGLQGMEVRSPYPSAWDFVREPPDAEGVLPAEKRKQFSQDVATGENLKRKARERAQREKERTR